MSACVRLMIVAAVSALPACTPPADLFVRPFATAQDQPAERANAQPAERANAQPAARANAQPMSLQDVLGAASNPLGWRSVAGKNVRVSGGVFWTLSKVVGNTYQITIKANRFASIVLSCTVAPDSMSTVASLKLNDPVTLIGKLANAPGGIGGNTAEFNGPCDVISEVERPLPEGAMTPALTVALEDLVAEEKKNPVAFHQKYIGQVVQISGGHVTGIRPDVFVIYHVAADGRHAHLNDVICEVQASARAGIAALANDQKVTVTGVLKDGDWNTGSLLRRLKNCTYQ